MVSTASRSSLRSLRTDPRASCSPGVESMCDRKRFRLSPSSSALLLIAFRGLRSSWHVTCSSYQSRRSAWAEHSTHIDEMFLQLTIRLSFFATRLLQSDTLPLELPKHADIGKYANKAHALSSSIPLSLKLVRDVDNGIAGSKEPHLDRIWVACPVLDSALIVLRSVRYIVWMDTRTPA